jgi:hypothetical protein
MTVAEGEKSRIKYKLKNIYSYETTCHEAHLKIDRLIEHLPLSSAAQSSLPASSPSSTRYSHSSR